MAINDDVNEDWIKTLSWDLGNWDEFLNYLGVGHAPRAAKRLAVAQFMRLPAWKAAPEEIRRQADELRS